jgi:hypothetical protein
MAGSPEPRYDWQRFWPPQTGLLSPPHAAFLRDPIDSLVGADKHLRRPNDYRRRRFLDLDLEIAPRGAAVQAAIRVEAGHAIERNIDIGVRR